jgi:flagellar basal-body rod protein FlgC
MEIGSLTRTLMRLPERMRPMFRSMGISASGLSAQRQRIDAIVSNIANAETTRTEEGGPYRRRTVEMAPSMRGPDGVFLEPGILWPTGDEAGELPIPPFDDFGAGVTVTGVVVDQTEGPLVYDPSHPDADGNGYVRMPNVDLTQEIVDLAEARRMYEANATAFQAVKSMLQRAAQL